MNIYHELLNIVYYFLIVFSVLYNQIFSLLKKDSSKKLTCLPEKIILLPMKLYCYLNNNRVYLTRFYFPSHLRKTHQLCLWGSYSTHL